MGLLQELASHPLAQQFQELPLGQQIGIGFGAFVVLSVVINVLNQLLFKNRNEPPLVFHWFPFIGSTITYGMDPPKFFKENRAKVRLISPKSRIGGESWPHMAPGAQGSYARNKSVTKS
jgi:sterol 14alpha-demethylase